MDKNIQNIDNFFVRKHSQDFFDVYIPHISHTLNLKNVFTIPKRDIIKLFDVKNYKNFLAYRFYLLKTWMSKNEKYTLEYVKKLDYLISKLYLWNELNSYEQQKIINVKDIVFAKIRNLKDLIVDFVVNKKEIIAFKYSNIYLSFKNKKMKKQKDISNCVLYISNQRIILTKGIETFSLPWQKINGYHFSKNQIELTTSNDDKYYLSASNNFILHVSFCRIFKIIKK